MDHDQPTGKEAGAERRSHARYTIELPAEVSLADGRDQRNGRILDYCIGGLFINVEGQDDDFLIMGGTQIGRDAMLQVRFKAPASSGGGPQDFVVGVRVCRLFLGGMGVAFDPNPEPAAILALQALADAGQKTQAGGAVAGERVQQAIELCHQQVQSWIKDHLNRLFKTAANELFIEARDATNNDIQNACMDAMKNVDRVKPAVCEDVLKSYQGDMNQLFPQLGIESSEQASQPELGMESELSLVDTGSFDDWVTIKNMMSRAEPKLRDSLHDLSRRLTTLTTAAVDELTNPAGIQQLCMGFNEAMQNLGLQRPARQAIYTSFEGVLIGDLAELYTDLNKQLEDLGIQPEAEQAKPSKSRRPPQRPPQADSPPVQEQPQAHGETGSFDAYEDYGQTGYPGAVQPAAAGSAPVQHPGTPSQAPQGANAQPPGSPQAAAVNAPQSAPVQGPPGYAVPPQPGTAMPPQPGTAMPPQPGTAMPPQPGTAMPPQPGTAVPPQPGTAAPPQPGYAAPPQPGTAPAGQSVPAQPAGAPAASPISPDGARQAIRNYTPAYQSPIQPATPQVGMAQAYQAARSLMGLQRAVASGGDVAALGDTGSLPPAAGAPSAPVMGALDQLQATPEFNAPVPGQGLHLRERLEKSLARDGIQLNNQEREAVQVLSSLLESIIGDPLIQGNMKPRIQRLAVPLTKVALQDEGFFAEDQHPARQVVNRLGMLGLPDELPDSAEGDSLKANIDPLLERIMADPHATPQTFESVLPDLDALIQRQQSQFSENIEHLIENRTQQQAVLASRRGSQDGGEARPVSAELRPWFQRTERLKVGDVVAFNAGTESPKSQTLAWVNEDHNAFVFADNSGRKTNSMGQQELALEMLRGSAKVLESADVPAMDRGVYDMLHRIHRDLSEEAERDSVTGLMSSSAFEKELEEAISRAQRRGSKHALLSLDLDGFSRVNENCGRKAGDSLLRKLSRLLSRQLEKSGAITRLHSDEFLILLLDHNYREAKRFADRQCRAIENSRVVFQGEQYPITASLGLLPVTRAGVSVKELIDNVQAAMLVAKQNGGNQVHLFDPDEQPAVIAKAGSVGTEELSLQVLFEQQGLTLMQQKVPSVTEADDKIHRQILIGIRQPDEQVVPADRELLNAAEVSGQSSSVDRWVIHDALAWMSTHRPKLLKAAGFSLRLSAGTLKEADLLEYVVAELTESSVPPAKVIFIIPESVAIDRLSSAVEFITSLREYGCRFAIDDFGSGHTTFSYLKTLPVDFVRIDSGFVSELGDNDSDYAMVKSINEIAHLLGKKTIAEGVADEAVYEKLKSLGVDYMQGTHAGEATLLD